MEIIDFFALNLCGKQNKVYNLAKSLFAAFIANLSTIEKKISKVYSFFKFFLVQRIAQLPIVKILNEKEEPYFNKNIIFT